MPAPSPRSPWRSVPGAVWALMGLHVALLCVYALLFPPYTGFDEPQHVDLVVQVAEGDTWPWPGPGELPLSVGVAESSNPVYFGALQPVPYGNNPYPDRQDRASLRELGGLAPATKNFPNQQIQHPPAYYVLGAAVLKAVPGDPLDLPYDVVVHVLRLLSIVLLAPLPLLAWLGARRLSPHRAAGLTAAATTLAVPGLMRVGSNVQNDDLLVLGASGLLVALIHVMTGDLRLRTAAAVGALTTLCLLTKGFALVLPAVVVAAYGVHRAGWRLPWKPVGAALAVSAIGLSWWVTNVVRFGTVQPSGLGPEADAVFHGAPTPGVERPLPTYAGIVLSKLNGRFWSSIGMPDAPRLPFTVTWGLTAAVLVLAGFALLRATRRRRAVVGVLLLPVPLILAVVVVGSLKYYRLNGQVPGVQGRYFYPALLGIAAVAALGLTAALRERRDWAPLAVLGAAGALQGYALFAVVAVYWVPAGDLGRAVDGVRHWSPWPVGVTVLPFLAVAVLGVLAAVLLVRELRSATRSEPGLELVEEH